MDPGNLVWYIVLLFFLILLNAFFAMSELAVIGLNDARVAKLAAEGDKKSKILLGLMTQPSRFLSTIQVGITLSGMLASAVAADTFADMLVSAVAGKITIPLGVVRGVSLVVITVLLSYLSIVFGELVPKRIAMRSPEKVAYSIAGVLNFLYRVEKPFVWLLSATANGVLRLIGIDPDADDENVTEEEIRMMVDDGTQKGVIEESQREMINNIFEFDDRTAGDVMTHRTEVEGVETDVTLPELIRLATETGFSRIPVYEDTLDDIKGVLYVKDLLPLLERQPAEFDVRSYMRAALFVPESNRCRELFTQFKEKKIQMAVVVDEYGGTSGIVTMEDLLESIVGNMQDEYDNEEEEVSKLGEGEYLLDGSLGLEEVGRLFKMELPGGEDYDTIGGLIIDELGHIPREGDTPSVTVAGIEFTVRKVEDRRIARVQARQLPQPARDVQET